MNLAFYIDDSNRVVITIAPKIEKPSFIRGRAIALTGMHANEQEAEYTREMLESVFAKKGIEEFSNFFHHAEFWSYALDHNATRLALAFTKPNESGVYYALEESDIECHTGELLNKDEIEATADSLKNMVKRLFEQISKATSTSISR